MENKLNSNIIAFIVYHLDRICRKDLSLGNIIDERNYVSNFTSHIRNPFGPFLNLQLGYARCLEPKLERKFGCDSIIIFKKNNHVKIGLFEAKWPRYFTNSNYSWDNMLPQNSQYPNMSRFNSQLLRQHNWNKSGAVIWEMFLNEQLCGQRELNWDEFGSSCLLYHDAIEYKTRNNVLIWNNSHLAQAIIPSMNLRRIVYNILRCNLGKIFNIDQNIVRLNGMEDSIDIPIILEEVSTNETILAFQRLAGVDNYFLLDIENLVDN